MTGAQPSNSGRRRFFARAAAAAGLVLAPGVVLLTTKAKAAATGPRWGLLIDLNKCPIDCSECVTACNDENGLKGHGRPLTDAQWIRKVDVRDPASKREWSVPVMCQHCEHPPCVDVCPTGASFQRDDGIVLVDKHICIGCRYCMMACPYKARSFIHEDLTDQKPHAPRGKGTVESCTLCVHRIDAGGQPACVERCQGIATGAMTFGDLNDPDSAIARRVATYATRRIRDDLGLAPGVYYQGL